MKSRFKLTTRKALIGLILLFSQSVTAQINPKNQQALLDSLSFVFPNEDVVILENKTEIKAFFEKSKANYKKTESETYIILRESGIEKLKSIEIPVYSEDRVDRSECYSVSINGKKNLARFIGISDRISESFVFFDGGKVAKFEYSNLGIGSVVTYTVEVNTPLMELPSIHIISDYRPCLKSEIVIDADNNIQYDVLAFNTDSLNVEQKQTDYNSHRTEIWNFSNIGRYTSEKLDRGALHILPHLYFYIKSYQLNSEEFIVNGHLNQLTNWYNKNVHQVVNNPLSTELIQLSKQITAPFNKEEDKVKAIYYWVQENIRYIAFEAGRDGFVPRLPSDVLSKRYGDCKDMSSIIYGLTKAIGIETNLTWVGTRDLPYSYLEYPFTFADNHMIATYEHNDSLYVLDATSSFQPMGVPTSMIQTKSLLVRKNDGAFEVTEVPLIHPKQKTVIDTTYLQLKGTTINGNSKVHFSGYSKLELHFAIHGTENENEKSMRLLSLLNRSNNNVSAHIQEIKNLDNRDTTSIVNYEFSISKYAIVAGNKTYLSLFLDPEELIYFDLKARKNGFELDYLQSNQHTIVLNLPTGGSIKDLPEAITIENKLVKFEISYKQLSATQIQCNYEMSNKVIYISPKDFQEYSDLVKQIRKISSQKLTITY